MSKTDTDQATNEELRVRLEDNKKNIQDQLNNFKKSCEAQEKHHRKRCKRRFYNLGLMAKIVPSTTEDEIQRLLHHGARTFYIDTIPQKPSELDELLQFTKNGIAEFKLQNPDAHIAVGLALEILGDSCRLGRMRNNESVYLQPGDYITLTTDEEYKYSSFREIAFVINLKHYLRTLNLYDVIRIGSDGVHGRVVKCFVEKVALRIIEGGHVRSYEVLELPNQCYSLKQDELRNLFTVDLEMAAQAKADFVVMSKIRCKPFLKVLRSNIRNNYKFKVIGSIDWPFVSSKMLDLMGIIEMLDYLWIPDMFTADDTVASYIYDDVIPLAKCQKKPIIGTVPLERCSDFERFENHEFLWLIDTIFIEKSPWCFKYPLIVKKLLPLLDFRKGVFINKMILKDYTTSFQAVVNYIIRTINSIECQAIIMHSDSEVAAAAMARVEIYCPVFVMLPIENEEEDASRQIIAKMLNLRRNLRSVVYTAEMNECNFKPIQYGIEYARHIGLLETGDFIFTLELCKEDGPNVHYGVGEDIALVRAIYLPPARICERYKYA